MVRKEKTLVSLFQLEGLGQMKGLFQCYKE